MERGKVCGGTLHDRSMRDCLPAMPALTRRPLRIERLIRLVDTHYIHFQPQDSIVSTTPPSVTEGAVPPDMEGVGAAAPPAGAEGAAPPDMEGSEAAEAIRQEEDDLILAHMNAINFDKPEAEIIEMKRHLDTYMSPETMRRRYEAELRSTLQSWKQQTWAAPSSFAMELRQAGQHKEAMEMQAEVFKRMYAEAIAENADMKRQLNDNESEQRRQKRPKANDSAGIASAESDASRLPTLVTRILVFPPSSPHSVPLSTSRFGFRLLLLSGCPPFWGVSSHRA